VNFFQLKRGLEYSLPLPGGRSKLAPYVSSYFGISNPRMSIMSVAVKLLYRPVMRRRVCDIFTDILCQSSVARKVDRVRVTNTPAKDLRVAWRGSTCMLYRDWAWVLAGSPCQTQSGEQGFTVMH
jgi:hypothetical protein